MKLTLVDNTSTKLLESLRSAIDRAAECRIAVAFISSSGLALLEDVIRRCVAREGIVEFLVGLDLSATEPEALWTIHRHSEMTPNVSLYCFSMPGLRCAYHPKLYITRGEEEALIVIGSSNLTEGGLKGNLELNVLIEADQHEEVVSDTYAAYNRLKFHPRRVRPDSEFLCLYEEMYRQRKQAERAFGRYPKTGDLKRRFAEKARSLSHPVATRRDLYGWQRLVFERLPNKPFRTSEIYAFEEEFGRHYPMNQNIRAKIRQILQQLRDMRLILHLGRSTWVKQELVQPEDAHQAHS
ncbi:MAG: phospholipase D-like domain-containing protein [candidate division KSB1 bacterium]|nr:phospholipase D-like domain-containing protein [candidate division KSB1 bacterium]